MGIVYALRGDSVTPRYLTAASPNYLFKNNAAAGTPATASDAGSIGGTVIDLDSGTYIRAIGSVAGFNFSQNAAFSILMSIVPRYTGTPSVNYGFFEAFRIASYFVIGHLTTDKLFVRYNDQYGTVSMNTATTSSWSPTSGTRYDIVLTWDGTASSNAAVLYVDASSFHSFTPSLAADHQSVPFGLFNSGTGSLISSTKTGHDLEELVIWDEVIDPTSVILTSGSGSLNGASRSAYVSVSASDGVAVSSPRAVGIGSIGY